MGEVHTFTVLRLIPSHPFSFTLFTRKIGTRKLARTHSSSVSVAGTFRGGESAVSLPCLSLILLADLFSGLHKQSLLWIFFTCYWPHLRHAHILKTSGSWWPMRSRVISCAGTFIHPSQGRYKESYVHVTILNLDSRQSVAARRISIFAKSRTDSSTNDDPVPNYRCSFTRLRIVRHRYIFYRPCDTPPAEPSFASDPH